MYKCNKCGICCKNLDKSYLYQELDRGDGVCKHLVNNLCSIYDNRPLLCRIDESYKSFYLNIMTLEEYYRLNYEACDKLRKETKEE